MSELKETRSPSPRAVQLAMFFTTLVVMTIISLSCATPTPSERSARLEHGAHEEVDDSTPVRIPKPALPEETDLLVQARKLGLKFAVAPAVSRDDATVRKLDRSCIACHGEYSPPDNHSMHATGVNISCVDCHGGTPDVAMPTNVRTADPATFARFKDASHVQPRSATRDMWEVDGEIDSANPLTPGARTLDESLDFIRFVNPGDLHVARAACGGCHNNEQYGYINDKVDKSMMSHGSMLWSAALYNNGAHNKKDAIYAEAYMPSPESIAVGDAKLVPAAIVSNRDPAKRPTPEQTRKLGYLDILYPLTRWEVSQPGNILRVFERGGDRRPNLGVPDPFDPPGKPDVKLSTRGLGTELRTDPVFLGLQKTRLLDPTLRTFGTNDHAGDYRGSGCTACHVVYANDSSPVHSAGYAQFGNGGKRASDSSDLAIDKQKGKGHPIHHVFAERNSIPSSQCMVCHVHPGTNVVNAYFGYTWWDNEVHAEVMYPKKQQRPTESQRDAVEAHNPEGTAPRGLWSNLYPGEPDHRGTPAPAEFLEQTGSKEFNAKLDKTQFADFHGHGWVFRAVFKRDRVGNLLDGDGKIVAQVTPEKLMKAVAHTDVTDTPTAAGVPVHLKDIHLERGMQCVDCHFQQDVHGDGKLYGETRNAVMIGCIDCHGTTTEPAVLKQLLVEDAKSEDDREENYDAHVASLRKRLFSGNAAISQSEDLVNKATKRFKLDGESLVQTAQVARDADGKLVEWKVKQTVETQAVAGAPADDPVAARARKALYAHSIRKDNKTWGAPPDPKNADPSLALAHGSNMSCYACHTSWNTSCFGCHLPMKADKRKPMLHNEGQLTRNYTNYNFQTIRDDVYMLGKDSTVKNGDIVPIRSACAVLVSSQDANRQWLYTQQQTISAEGFAGTAFSPYFPHTVRAAETKQCTDCHLSNANDNNAIMSQLLLTGTKSVNFVGRFSYVACGEEGLEAVAVTERDEPQAVLGSRLHEFAYPDDYAAHLKRNSELSEMHEKAGFNVKDVQLRGEYLYAACGKDGFIAFDVANIDNKGFSERIITAPASPLGQRLFVKTPDATSVCTPSTLAIDPTRPRRPENEEGPIAPLYAFIYVTDSQEGLVVVGNPLDDKNGAGVSTLLDGDPNNNFLSKALSFNPNGALNGARHMKLTGNLAYVACDAGVRVVDLTDPLHPVLLDTPGMSGFRGARKVFFQFRYAFVVDADGLKVVDITNPRQPRTVTSAMLRFNDARDIYISRTYGYVAAGQQGLGIVDLTNPEKPKLVEMFKDGLLDATAVRVGMTNASMYAYVADGFGGLKVLQLTSADDRDGTPTFQGFSPRPKPRVIAVRHTRGPAISLSEGLDRDRAVDEAGQQLAVFGRRGARPFNFEEMSRLYLRKDVRGAMTPWRVTDVPVTAPIATAVPASSSAPMAGTAERR
jgi:hypothetical protein